MISVLLTLLKIIGIVILSLLGLLLVLLLIVLFVPVRYRLKGYFKDEFACQGKINWLLHLVSVTIDYEKELVTSIRIFGIDISSFLNKKKDSASNNTQNKTDNQVQPSLSKTNTSKPDTVTGKNQKEGSNPFIETDDITLGSESLSDTKESKSIFDKIKNFFIRIKEKIESVYNKIIEIIHNLKTKKDSIERYIRILQREEVKNSFSLCKSRIMKMVKHILPKNIKIHAHIGMEDPSTTGYILAAYSVLPQKLRRQIILKAYFDEVIMEGDFNIKGSCHAFGFLYHIISIIINKNCRTFYKLVKKEISNERK